MADGDEDTSASNHAKPDKISVSDKRWQKFKELQQKRQAIAKRYEDRRIQQIQKETLAAVKSEIQDPEGKDILEKHGVELNPRKGIKRKLVQSEECSSTNEASSSETNVKEWGEIKKYLHVNKHLDAVDKGRYAAKTELEKQIDKAVADGDVELAEKLSDRLAERDFGTAIAGAIDAKRFSEKKEEEDTEAKEKQQKKLHWGFNHKERWEMKGNM